jgi:signal peptidase II
MKKQRGPTLGEMTRPAMTTTSTNATTSLSKHYWLVVPFTIVLDQLSKYWCSNVLAFGVPQTVFPGFDLLLAHNYGAAFSFLDDAGGWQRWFLTAVAVVLSTVLAFWLWRLQRNQRLLGMALALVLGGALGNLVDRVMLGYVVDFISVYYGQWRFATFNVADAAISCGAALLLFDAVLHGERHG